MTNGESSSDNEEREERKQRQVGEISGVNEAVVIDANANPLDDLPRVDAVLKLDCDVTPKGGAHARKLLTPLFRR